MPAKSWPALIIKELRMMAPTHGKLSITPGRLLDVELVLTLFSEYLVDQDPRIAWIVLSGHRFPAVEKLDTKAKCAIDCVRLHLGKPLGRSTWDEWLKRYQQLPPAYPLYHLDKSTLKRQQSTVAPNRLQILMRALEQGPEIPCRKARYAQPGHYSFYVDKQRHEVEIPDFDGESIQADSTPLVPLLKPFREPVKIKMSDLYATARWMDAHASPGSAAAKEWGIRFKGISWQGILPSGLTTESEMTLNGVLHLIGMVGSGKSTFLTVLAVHLAQLGQRVVLVQGDVASLFREFAVFDALSHADTRLNAVPLIGRSTRVTHLNRLHLSEAMDKGINLHQRHPAFNMLSTVCPLDGLRRDVQPIPLGHEPCTKLYSHDLDTQEITPKAKLPFDCPFMPACPVHLPSRSLAKSNIWLATPASLLSSSPQVPLLSDQGRYFELVMRYADAVLVDEADLVQVQFDDRFAPTEVLVGGEHGWLDRLASQVGRQLYRSGRPLVGRDEALDRWLASHHNVQRAVDRLYCWIRESIATRNMLSGSYFSSEWLLKKLVLEIGKANVSTETFSSICEDLSRSNWLDLQPSYPDAWREAIQAELLGHDQTEVLNKLEEWIQETLSLPATVSTLQVEHWAHYLLISLLVSVIERSLRRLVNDWGSAEDHLELDRGEGGLFYSPADGAINRLPVAPMGAVFGFQYYDVENKGDGELRFFRLGVIGRALLYRLHDGLQRSEGIAGPHVLLTSGTSWAPGSWGYHLHEPPRAVLLPQREKTSTVSCFFEHLVDPDQPSKRLAVSGLHPAEQVRSLKAMVKQLAQKRTFGPSLLEAELGELPEEKRRILLIVGSYEEAEIVGAALSAELGAEPGTEVLTLVPDIEDALPEEQPSGTLLRSMLSRMPEKSAKYLVAPLRAIERGHNILVGQQAAIGSIYFLKRPMPAPGDPHTAVHQVNSWAMQFVPTLTDQDIVTSGMTLRNLGRDKWNEALDQKLTYIGAQDPTALLWTQLVLVWQSIGRLLRGGESARVHFIDAQWGRVTSGLSSGTGDTEETSMLLGFERVLREAIFHADPAHRDIAQALYGSFYLGLKNIEGLTRA